MTTVRYATENFVTGSPLPTLRSEGLVSSVATGTHAVGGISVHGDPGRGPQFAFGKNWQAMTNPMIVDDRYVFLIGTNFYEASYYDATSDRWFRINGLQDFYPYQSHFVRSGTVFVFGTDTDSTKIMMATASMTDLNVWSTSTIALEREPDQGVYLYGGTISGSRICIVYEEGYDGGESYDGIALVSDDDGVSWTSSTIWRGTGSWDEYWYIDRIYPTDVGFFAIASDVSNNPVWASSSDGLIWTWSSQLDGRFAPGQQSAYVTGSTICSLLYVNQYRDQFVQTSVDGGQTFTTSSMFTGPDYSALLVVPEGLLKVGYTEYGRMHSSWSYDGGSTWPSSSLTNFEYTVDNVNVWRIGQKYMAVRGYQNQHQVSFISHDGLEWMTPNYSNILMQGRVDISGVLTTNKDVRTIVHDIDSSAVHQLSDVGNRHLVVEQIYKSGPDYLSTIQMASYLPSLGFQPAGLQIYCGSGRDGVGQRVWIYPYNANIDIDSSAGFPVTLTSSGATKVVVKGQSTELSVQNDSGRTKINQWLSNDVSAQLRVLQDNSTQIALDCTNGESSISTVAASASHFNVSGIPWKFQTTADFNTNALIISGSVDISGALTSSRLLVTSGMSVSGGLAVSGNLIVAGQPSFSSTVESTLMQLSTGSGRYTGVSYWAAGGAFVADIYDPVYGGMVHKHSYDGGRTWRSKYQFPIGKNDTYGFFVLGDGIISFDQGRLWRSTNPDMTSWVSGAQSSFNLGPTTVAINGNTILAMEVGFTNRFAVSYDSGSTWAYTGSLNLGTYISAVAASGTSGFIAIASDNVNLTFIKTTNPTGSWSSSSIGTGVDFNVLVVMPSGRIIATGNSQLIRYSDNGGTSWSSNVSMPYLYAARGYVSGTTLLMVGSTNWNQSSAHPRIVTTQDGTSRSQIDPWTGSDPNFFGTGLGFGGGSYVLAGYGFSSQWSSYTTDLNDWTLGRVDMGSSRSNSSLVTGFDHIVVSGVMDAGRIFTSEILSNTAVTMSMPALMIKPDNDVRITGPVDVSGAVTASNLLITGAFEYSTNASPGVFSLVERSGGTGFQPTIWVESLQGANTLMRAGDDGVSGGDRWSEFVLQGYNSASAVPTEFYFYSGLDAGGDWFDGNTIYSPNTILISGPDTHIAISGTGVAISGALTATTIVLPFEVGSDYSTGLKFAGAPRAYFNHSDGATPSSSFLDLWLETSQSNGLATSSWANLYVYSISGSDEGATLLLQSGPRYAQISANSAGGYFPIGINWSGDDFTFQCLSAHGLVISSSLRVENDVYVSGAVTASTILLPAESGSNLATGLKFDGAASTYFVHTDYGDGFESSSHVDLWLQPQSKLGGGPYANVYAWSSLARGGAEGASVAVACNGRLAVLEVNGTGAAADDFPLGLRWGGDRFTMRGDGGSNSHVIVSASIEVSGALTASTILLAPSASIYSDPGGLEISASTGVYIPSNITVGADTSYIPLSNASINMVGSGSAYFGLSEQIDPASAYIDMYTGGNSGSQSRSGSFFTMGIDAGVLELQLDETLSYAAVSSTLPLVIGSDISVTVSGVLTASAIRITQEVWDDIFYPIDQAAGTGALAFDQYGTSGMRFYHWSNSQVEPMYVSWQMPHGWRRDSEVRPHIHVMPAVNPTSSATVFVTGAYAWSHNGQLLASASWTPFSATLEVSTTSSGYAEIIPLFSTTPSGSKESSILCVWFQRDVGAGDTYRINKSGGTVAANLAILSVDAHYQREKNGTLSYIPA